MIDHVLSLGTEMLRDRANSTLTIYRLHLQHLQHFYTKGTTFTDANFVHVSYIDC